ncbi:hypothetical protein AAMO2058_001546300 [Amorphochlora amoebiformis]|mmetsp:Transcript_3612/g.5564  ORF Transcript_3612/g.5564 Transcript_3612/m.5564 type:complete len:284 (-) Transcript_3612:249-1100(-)
MSDNPGMMGEAYFVGKRQLLRWINSFLCLNYTKVEQVASGVAYCQILDALFPGKVALSKVNFDAKYDYDYVKNFKVIQSVFERMNVQKAVPVQKLVKAKYQDNLEFLQWFKNFFDVRYNGETYDAIARKNAALRKQGKKVIARGPKLTTGSRSESKLTAQRRGVPSKSTSNPMSKSASRLSGGQSNGGGRPVGVRTPSAAESKRLKEKEKKIKQQEGKIEELAGHVELLEKERTFYYTKLRNIEVYLQEVEDPTGIKDKVLEILYQTDEGFEAPEEEEGVEAQ